MLGRPRAIKRGTYLIAMGLVLLVMTGCMLVVAASSGADTDVMTRLAQGGPIRVGYAIEPPFAYMDDNGAVHGEAPDTLRAVLHGIQVDNIVWMYADFGSLMHELQSRRIDVIATGMFITPERAQQVLFSTRTMTVASGLMLRPGDRGRYRSISDFVQQGQTRLAVLAGSVEATRAVRMGVPRERLLEFADTQAAAAAVRNDTADALALSRVSLRSLMQLPCCTGLIEMAEHAPDRSLDGHPAFAFHRDDTRLRDAINAQLAVYLASSQHRDLLRQLGLDQAGDEAGS